LEEWFERNIDMAKGHLIFSSVTFRAALTLALLGWTSSAIAQNPLAERWADPQHFDKALIQARNTGQVVAVAYATNGPLMIIGNNETLGHRVFNNCLRVGAWASEMGGTPTGAASAKLIQTYSVASGKEDARIPRVFFVAPNGRLVGVMLYTDLQRVEGIAKRSEQIVGWYMGCHRSLDRAEGAMIQGRFKAALAMLEKIMEEDVKASKSLSDDLQITFDPTKHPGTIDDATYWADRMTAYQEEFDKVTAEIEELKAANKPVRGKKLPDRPLFSAEVFDTQAEADVTGATFFPKLLSVKKEQYNQMAMQVLTGARELHAQGKTVQAIAMIQPMVRDGADLPAISDAKAQLEQWSPAKK
jgi:hypothetical protein